MLRCDDFESGEVSSGSPENETPARILIPEEQSFRADARCAPAELRFT